MDSRFLSSEAPKYEGHRSESDSFAPWASGARQAILDSALELRLTLHPSHPPELPLVLQAVTDVAIDGDRLLSHC